ncbi:unnamed protein product [Lota lota]
MSLKCAGGPQAVEVFLGSTDAQVNTASESAASRSPKCQEWMMGLAVCSSSDPQPSDAGCMPANRLPFVPAANMPRRVTGGAKKTKEDLRGREKQGDGEPGNPYSREGTIATILLVVVTFPHHHANMLVSRWQAVSLSPSINDAVRARSLLQISPDT